jgi:preprotein translocase subunit YajC
MNQLLTMLAQEPVAPPRPAGGETGGIFLFAAMLALLAFMLLTSRSQRKREERERQNMYSRLSKNDRVLTIGGVIGTIVSVKDNEVVLKVDEATNTKMTFLKSSVQRILTEEAGVLEKT